MMKIRLSILALLCGLMGFAQPANNDCASATQIAMGGPEICIPTLGDNTGATDSLLTPGCANYGGGAVWFSVLVPSTGVAIIETSAAEGGFTDTGMAAYTGTCDDLTLVECDDDGGIGTYSMLELSDLTPNTILYIAVWEYGGNEEGEFNICTYQPPTCPDIEANTFTTDSVSVDYISLTWETLVDGSTYYIEYGPTGFTPGMGTTVTGVTGVDGPPVEITGLETFTAYDFSLYAVCDANTQTDTIFNTFSTAPGILTNDDCETAINLPVSGPAMCNPTTGFNDGATDSGVAHSCASYLGGDVWFSFIAPANGEVWIETMENNGFADGGMALYSGTCGDLVEIECNDDGGDGLFSLIQATDLVPSTVYYVAVWEYGNNATGAFDICVYAPPTCPNPGQFSFFADSLASDAASITWTVENSGSTYVIEYGPDGFTPGTGMTITGVEDTDGPPALITGLDPETTYDYYYQGACAPGDSTEVMGPYGFTTLETCATFSFFQITLSDVGVDFAEINWPSNNPGSTYYVEYGASGFLQGTGTVLTGVVGVDGPPVLIPGLTLATEYEAYIQEDCGGGDSTAVVGPFAFETNSLPPANDNLCDAIEIIVDAVEIASTNSGATPEDGELPGSCWGSNNDGINLESVWHSFVAPASGIVNVSTDYDDQELHDTHITVYELTGDCSDLSTLVEVACNEDGGDATPNGWSSFIQVTDLTPGATYYVQVDGWAQGDGAFLISVTGSAVGVNELEAGVYSLYPNPAQDQLSIVSSEVSGLVTIEIIDLQGKVAVTSQENMTVNSPVTLNISTLESGVYMVRMISAEGQSVQRLIVR